MTLMSKTAGDLNALAPLHVFGYMAHPFNSIKRDEWHTVMFARVFSEAGADIGNWYQESMPALLRGGARGMGSDFDDAAIPGFMAGDVLLSVLQMQAAGVADAGLDKACHMASELYRARPSRAGKPYKAGRDTVANNWKAFRPVAHYWAALAVFIELAEYKNCDPGRFIFDSSNRWLQFAEGIRIAATACNLPRSNSTLLDAEAWELAGVEPDEFQLPPFNERELAALDKFEARFR